MQAKANALTAFAMQANLYAACSKGSDSALLEYTGPTVWITCAAGKSAPLRDRSARHARPHSEPAIDTGCQVAITRRTPLTDLSDLAKVTE